jgi:hypothetical protein
MAAYGRCVSLTVLCCLREAQGLHLPFRYSATLSKAGEKTQLQTLVRVVFRFLGANLAQLPDTSALYG